MTIVLFGLRLAPGHTNFYQYDVMGGGRGWALNGENTSRHVLDIVFMYENIRKCLFTHGLLYFLHLVLILSPHTLIGKRSIKQQTLAAMLNYLYHAHNNLSCMILLPLFSSMVGHAMPHTDSLSHLLTAIFIHTFFFADCSTYKLSPKINII